MVETFDPGVLAADRTPATDSTLTPAADLSRYAMGLAMDKSLTAGGKTTFEPTYLDMHFASLPGYEDEPPILDGSVVPEDPATEVPEDKENLEERFQNVPAECDQLVGHEGLEDLLDMTWPSYENALNTLPPELQKNDAFMDNLGNLPNLVYSGQSDQAAVIKFALLKAAGEEGRPALEEYFKSIDKIAMENPELVAEITSAQKNCKPGEN
jgi:hypothetical protein